MNKAKIIVSAHALEKGSYRTYTIGFLLSLFCTLSAYILVVNHVINQKWALALVVAVFALIQFVTQLTLFLHLGLEAKPRLKLLVFGFMISVVIILVGGSIWIMYNLNYRMMTPSQINSYMKQQDGGF